jgi:hypothetical protein
MRPDVAQGIATFADLAARHAVALLLGLVVALLAASGVAWRLIERHAPRLLARAARAWHVVDRERLAARYLGVHALASFLLAGAGVVAFFELVDETESGEALAAFDVALAEALGRHLDAGTLALAGAITHLGDPVVLYVLALAVALTLVVRRERQLALAWIVDEPVRPAVGHSAGDAGRRRGLSRVRRAPEGAEPRRPVPPARQAGGPLDPARGRQGSAPARACTPSPTSSSTSRTRPSPRAS